MPGRVSKSLVKSPPTHRQTPREGEGGAQREDRTRASKKTASCDFPRARGGETQATSAAVAPGVKHRGTRGCGRGCSFGTIVKTERGAGSLQTDSCAPAWHVSSQWRSGGRRGRGGRGGRWAARREPPAIALVTAACPLTACDVAMCPSACSDRPCVPGRHMTSLEKGRRSVSLQARHSPLPGSRRCPAPGATCARPGAAAPWGHRSWARAAMFLWPVPLPSPQDMHTHTCSHSRRHTCSHTLTPPGTHAHTHVHTVTHMHVHPTQTHAHTHMFTTHTHRHACTPCSSHTGTHIHTHTHVYTHTPSHTLTCTFAHMHSREFMFAAPQRHTCSHPRAAMLTPHTQTRTLTLRHTHLQARAFTHTNHL